MLTRRAPQGDDPLITALRRREFSRLDREKLVYLDYTGSALYADCQLRSHQALLTRGVFGNPHAESDPSRASTAGIEKSRGLVLRFLDADPRRYAVCFTANTSAAIKLVAESYPFDRDGALVLSADNHNSVNGIRQYARRASAALAHVPLAADLRMDGAESVLAAIGSTSPGARLFAFPAQSNFSGVHHPLGLIDEAQRLGFDVLLDAAAFAPSNPLSLRAHEPEFVVLSFYKLFGYPTGVGALVVRTDALRKLRRPWFAGGTVDFASVQNEMFQLKNDSGAFEDGTPDFLNIAALPAGFALLEAIGMRRIHEHVMRLTTRFLDGLDAITHSDGTPAVRIYGPRTIDGRGGTVAFNVLSAHGRAIPYPIVERRARDAGIAIRGGCFCNPGAAEHAFGFDASRSNECLHAASARGFTIDRFAECLGEDTAVGAIRASMGVANNDHDVDRALEMIWATAAMPMERQRFARARSASRA
jgi:selenocysteine lyase/cysteine desulfurase